MHSYYLRNGAFFRELNPIVFYACDPGGWAVIRHLSKFLQQKGHTCRFLLEGWAQEHAAGAMNPHHLISREDLQKSAPEHGLLVYGAQQNFAKNYEMVSGATRMGLKTLFVFDSWKNYLVNFRDPKDGRMYMPARIAVIDEKMKQDLMKALSGYETGDLERKIDILGQPAMDASLAYIRSLPPEKVRALKAGFNEDGKKLRLFVMEPIRDDFLRVNGIHPGYDEYSILDHFLSGCPKEGSKVLIKVHPRQNQDEVQAFIRSQQPRWDHPYVQVVSGGKIEDLIAIADEVYGMTSIALNVAIRCGKPVRSIQVGRNEYGKSLSNSDLEARLIE